ncbi:hypothetical protein I0C86_06050 [Plantactinospora sp. S1510]|uniref:Uncharacterized protein n=1 Tax=Plantactinospora alkalitolerans TaxID=2789879 RepID=A0ABS0GQT3_9ACTN|nr:hypothetical protein [Plantactinospora alkalitolerans]MBF9128553.1 hypothetical protein [Plantactinospora alkalitolerans]
MHEEPTPAGFSKRGATFDDLAAFLQQPDPGGYPVQAVRECVCRSCGGRSFEVALMEEERAARRTCLTCGESEFIADSEEYWDDDTEVDHYCACSCGGEEFAGAVGYSLREDGDVRWVFVGLRCLACGGLGIYEDWKISYGPSAFLLDRA